MNQKLIIVLFKPKIMCCEVEGIQSKVVFLDILYVTHEVMSDCKKETFKYER